MKLGVLVKAMFLAIGIILLPWLIMVGLDLIAIATGWEVSAGFFEKGLSVWPGGDLIRPLFFSDSPSLLDWILEPIQVLVTVVLTALCPNVGHSLPDRKLDRWTARMVVANPSFSSRVWRFIWATLANALITIVINMVVGNLISQNVTKHWWVAPLCIAIIVMMVWGFTHWGSLALKAGIPSVTWGFAHFGFRVLIAFGQYALVTFALIVISRNPVAGGWTMVLCLVAHECLSMVDDIVKKK